MPSSKPVVSIGIPTYNRAAMLTRAIESALVQDYANIEIVISDNASTDETEAICRKYEAKYDSVHYLRRKVNAGQLINIYELIGNSSGRFFMWLSDDDWLDEDYVSRCMSTLIKEQDYALVCGKTKYFRGEENIYDAPATSLLHETGSERVAAYYAELYGNEIFYGVMRREVVQRIPPFQQVMGFDCLIASSIAFLGKVKTIEDTHINRTVGGTSATPEKMAAILSLPTIQARFYRESIAWFAFRDIMWRSPLYRTLGVAGRFRLALKSHMGVYRMHVIPKLAAKLPLLRRAVKSWRYVRGRLGVRS